MLAKSSNDIKEAHEAGKGSLILGFQNAIILGEDDTLIDTYFESGVRVFALTHMGHNDFADSSRPLYVAEIGDHEPEEEHGGLSDKGRAARISLSSWGSVESNK